MIKNPSRHNRGEKTTRGEKINERIRGELVRLRQRVAELEALQGKYQQTVKNLEEAERFLSNIFSSIQDGISILDTRLNIIRVNPTLEKWYPHAMPLVGKKCYKAYHSRKRPCKICPTQQTLKTGKPSYEIVPKRGPKGIISGWLDLYSFPFLEQHTGRMRGVIEYVRDITDRKIAEERLQASEEELRAIFDEAQIGIAALDLTGKIIRVNKYLLEESGYAEEELIGKRFQILKAVSPKTLAKMLLVLSRIRKGQYIPPYEAEVTIKSGEKRTVEIRNSLLRKNGKVMGAIAILSDITDLKKKETELQVSEEKYRTLTENINVGIYRNTVGPIGKFIEVNPALVKMFGYSTKEEFLKMKVADFYQNPEDRKSFNEQMLKNGFVRDKELFLKKKDGAPLIGSVSAVAVKDKKGKILYYDGIIEDVTERKKLQEMRDRLFNLSLDMFCIAGFDGYFKQLNPAWKNTLGWTNEELLSKPWLEFVHPEDGESTAVAIRNLTEGKNVLGFESRYICKDGSYKWISLNAFPLVQENLIFSVARDVTERKQAEDQIRSSLQEKEILLREIHHRVKNNMQIMSSLLSLQARYMKEPGVLAMFKESQNRIRSMALVHEKLYQSKDLSKIDFSEYVQNLAIHLFNSYQLDPDRVHLKTDVEKVYLNINTAIPCGLMLNELISNSLKHAFPGERNGEIEIHLHPAAGNKFLLAIRDDGVGFRQDLDFRHTETLGMQIVNMLVDQINGSIELKREKGTHFRIVFGELKYRQRTESNGKG